MSRTKIKNYIDAASSPWGLVFFGGGNPPVSEGIFNSDGDRMAWWPAEIEPSDENIARVVQELIWKRETDTPISRAQIRRLFQ